MNNQFSIPGLYRTLSAFKDGGSSFEGKGYRDEYSFEDGGPDFSDNASARKNYLGVEVLMPLKLSLPNGEMWEFPVEAIVSVNGKHIRTDRYPKKGDGSGSHKEYWSMDDYSISIKGILINFQDDAYPEEDSFKLRSIVEHGEAKVECSLFRIWGIERIVIDDWDIPFTQGATLQEYSINAKSDKLFDSLLTEI